jgi:hypothetical protein
VKLTVKTGNKYHKKWKIVTIFQNPKWKNICKGKAIPIQALTDPED